MKYEIATRSTKDRIRYAVLFELILISVMTICGSIFLDRQVFDIGLLMAVLSLKAMLVGFIYNWLFDQMDVRANRIPTERSFAGRVVHAVGFEFGLVLTSLPIVMWWLGLTILQALMMDIIVTSMVVIYTMMFGWVYDKLFPISQTSACRPA